MDLQDIIAEAGIPEGLQQQLGGHHLVGATVTTSVAGFAQLERALNELPEALARGALLTATKKGTQEFKDRAIEYAPFDAHDKDGKKHLMDGILQSITVGSSGVRGSWIRGRVGLTHDVFYGRFLEFGWLPARGTKKVEARPFMQRAFEVGQNFALITFENELRTGLEAAILAVGGHL